MSGTWSSSRKENGIVVVTIDQPNRSVNALSRNVIEELDQLLVDLERDSSIKAVLFISGKKGSFIVGADVEEMKELHGAEAARTFSSRGQKVFERLSRLSVPTVALISGPCLGGGLEFAMACRYRIADESRKTLLGLPEVKLGLVPGWGGTVRLPRLVGTLKAVTMITSGQMLNARQAKSAGLVDDFTPVEALLHAGELIVDRPPKKRKKSFTQRWLMESKVGRKYILNQAEKMILSKSHGHYPAPIKAVEVLRAGILGSAEEGFLAESATIGKLADDPVTTECVRLFFLREESKKWAETAAPSVGDVKIKSAAVLGAGTMGACLAYVMADKGMEVRLKDISTEFLAKGLKHAKGLWDKDVKKRKMSQREANDGLAKISTTTDYSGFKHLDIVIEAVVEDIEIKRQVFRDLEKACGPDTILASNTSSLLISDIAAAVERPERVIGVHFFNPPNQMPLVEIVRTEHTSQEALATALALTQKMGKTPIVVRECAGFLVNRLLMPYMNEAGFLLAEVDDPMELEKAAIEFGFPMGPLKLTDLVGAGVASKVSKVLHNAFGDRMEPAPAWRRLAELQQTAGKGTPQTLLIKGRRGKRELNPEVARMIAQLRREAGRTEPLSRSEIAERMVFPIINEAARCLDEGIVEHAEQVDLAMVFGTGFAPFRGGPLRYADKVGVDYVVQTLERFAEKHPRLAPCDALRRRASEGIAFESALTIAR
ncbi:MAG: 3-hydroxyacyl-CoA dehydrogenase NAD-binding domain-containing protein [Planctomycetota bacterium]